VSPSAKSRIRSQASVANTPQEIGLISDTHGLLRPKALQALRGSDLIIHAGDVGDSKILDALSKIAPLVVIRGNIDTSEWAKSLPETAVAQAGSVSIYVLHDVKTLDLDPKAGGFHIVVSGHSHKPERSERNGVIYINPGSAGPRRFHLPITVARLDLGIAPWSVEFIDLEKGRTVK
jgi:putative phosphoesterase